MRSAMMTLSRSRSAAGSAARAARMCRRSSRFARRTGSSVTDPGSIMRRVARSVGLEQPVHVVQVDRRQTPDGLLEANLREDRRIVGAGQIALGAVEQLLRVEHVDLGPHADFLTEL